MNPRNKIFKNPRTGQDSVPVWNNKPYHVLLRFKFGYEILKCDRIVQYLVLPFAEEEVPLFTILF